MNIPEKFELMGDTITVKFVNSLITEDDTVGQASYRMNEPELTKDEDFVDTFANLLLQFEKTTKGELNQKGEE